VDLDQSLPRLLSSLRRDDPSATEYLAELLDRVERLEPELQAFLPEPERAARLQRELDSLSRSSPERPPWFGVPFGVKDIFRVDGLPTRAGSKLPPEALAGDQAEAVRRLRAAGALVLGKTVTTEFAYFAPGPTRNPRNTAHTPGGSSSGSAAAVAAGLCPLSLGTQTIGSVIRPAAYCGIVGFKPTFRRIPVDGVIPLAPSLDHVGFFTLDVVGAADTAEAICDGWRATAVVDPPVIGIPDGPYMSKAGDEARACVQRSAERLMQAGLSVRTVEVLADFDDVVARHQTILAAEAARVHTPWFDTYAELYHERTARLIVEGRRIEDEELARARDGQAVLRRELQATMDGAGLDIWLTPATVGPAPLGLESTGDPVMNLPWTQAGFPALTIPGGIADYGLPLGLQLVARFYDDERLLAWAAQLERLVGLPLGVASLDPSPAAQSARGG
jgi:Asp-tRNA(Asn)/Glu-tRNA(Gln) amidotransferase A subunit family amidase